MSSSPRLAALIPALGLVLAAAPAAGAPPQTAAPPLTVRQVRGPIYEAEGGAINRTGFYLGAREVLAIDAKQSVEGTRALVAAIRTVTPLPITLVALTHSDGDHVGGLPGFPPTVRVIAQRNARRDLVRPPVAAALRPYLPTFTFTTELDLHLGPSPVRLVHLGPAHTDGDVVVYFPAERVAMVGDLVFLHRDPLIHRAAKHGSSAGLVQALDDLLKLDADTFLSGHSRPATRADVAALRATIAGTRAKVQGLVALGRSLAEVKRALKIEDQPVPPGGRRWPSLVEIVYAELTEKPKPAP